MKYILINKKNNEIKAICDDKINYDKSLFKLERVSLTKEKFKQIDQGPGAKYKYKKIIPGHKRIKPIKIKEKINKAKTLDELKQIIIENLLK